MLIGNSIQTFCVPCDLAWNNWNTQARSCLKWLFSSYCESHQGLETKMNRNSKFTTRTQPTRLFTKLNMHTSWDPRDFHTGRKRTSNHVVPPHPTPHLYPAWASSRLTWMFVVCCKQRNDGVKLQKRNVAEMQVHCIIMVSKLNSTLSLEVLTASDFRCTSVEYSIIKFIINNRTQFEFLYLNTFQLSWTKLMWVFITWHAAQTWTDLFYKKNISPFHQMKVNLNNFFIYFKTVIV